MSVDGAAPIRTDGLTKHYDDVVALEDLTLEVNRAEVFGFLGPNGAGKTTTIRSLLSYLRPTRGSATVLGLDAATQSVEIRRHIGYAPSEYEMYDKLTGAEMLQYYANLRGGVDQSYVAELADRLRADLGKNMRDYSTGNKQKICLIQAFMNKPDLVILDEPSTGLDPLMQQVLQELISDVRADGRTVFLSSHSLSEVERVADRVGILRQGRLVVVERVDQLKRKAIRRLDMDFEGAIAETDFTAIPHVRSVEVIGAHASVSFDGAIADVLRVALDHEVVNLNSEDADLEEIFMTYYRDEPAVTRAD